MRKIVKNKIYNLWIFEVSIHNERPPFTCQVPNNGLNPTPICLDTIRSGQQECSSSRKLIKQIPLLCSVRGGREERMEWRGTMDGVQGENASVRTKEERVGRQALHSGAPFVVPVILSSSPCFWCCSLA